MASPGICRLNLQGESQPDSLCGDFHLPPGRVISESNVCETPAGGKPIVEAYKRSSEDCLASQREDVKKTRKPKTAQLHLSVASSPDCSRSYSCPAGQAFSHGKKGNDAERFLGLAGNDKTRSASIAQTCDEKRQYPILGLAVVIIVMNLVLVVLCVFLTITCLRLSTRVASLEQHCGGNMETKGRPAEFVAHADVPYVSSDMLHRQMMLGGRTNVEHFASAITSRNIGDSPGPTSPNLFNVAQEHTIARAQSRSKRGQSDNVTLSTTEMTNLMIEAKKTFKRLEDFLLADEFVAAFWEIFNFNEDFSSEDCISKPEWKVGHQACKETQITFYKEGTPLPFFIETRATFWRRKKDRLIKLSETGQFKVKSSGLYLIHFNITIRDETGKHYLALFLNDVAVMACEGGGFICPYRENFHKICNIQGMLDLAKNDEVEIRTMHPNTTLRLETFRTPYFRFVQLTSPSKESRKDCNCKKRKRKRRN